MQSGGRCYAAPVLLTELTACARAPPRNYPRFLHTHRYDQSRRRLVTAVHRPYVWPHKLVSQDRTGHRESVRAALYNSCFHVVVTADEVCANCPSCQQGLQLGRCAGRLWFFVAFCGCICRACGREVEEHNAAAEPLLRHPSSPIPCYNT